MLFVEILRTLAADRALENGDNVCVPDDWPWGRLAVKRIVF